MPKKRKRKYQHRIEESYEPESLMSSETKKSVAIIILFVLATLSILSFFDLAGALGTFIKQALEAVFGWGSFLLPVILLVLGYFLLIPEKYEVKPSNYLGLFFFVLSYSGILQFIKDTGGLTTFAAGVGGGYLGFFVFLPLQKIMGSGAALIVLIALFLISLLVTFNTTLATLVKKINLLNFFKRRIAREIGEGEDEWETDEQAELNEEDWEKEEEETAEEELEEKSDFTKKKIIIPVKANLAKSFPDDLKVTFSKGRRKKIEVPLSLLEGKSSKPTSGDIKLNSEIIQATLEDFGIPVEMGEVNVGPTVTQFTFKPQEGIKLARITALQDNLALALAAHPIRIEAPIPGKSLVGVELPNQSIAIVKLKDILASSEFKNKKGKLKIGLGEDVSGKAWVVNLESMPHLLIAGATGSGKSVCINNIIVSLLYQYPPEQLKFIIIDPKRVDLINYSGIPHLLTPVIIEVDKTINALRWVVREMDERFRLLNSKAKRNIEAYNSSVLINKLPYIVIVIDELHGLMSVSPRDVEAAIVRLAQMARAVGIHLVVATQRPSVNVITGLIKANITARIAFAVASQVDSRTILDVAGAEKLLGKGDLLYSSAVITKPRRIQGAFLTDPEIERVIDFWKQQAEPDYIDEVCEPQSHVNLPGLNGLDNSDELLEEAKDVIIKAGKASASLLQRRLRVGYARAARILDLLEKQGIIGPVNGAKPREILVSDAYLLGIPSETTERYTSDSDEEEDEEEKIDEQGEEIDESDDYDKDEDYEEEEDEEEEIRN